MKVLRKYKLEATIILLAILMISMLTRMVHLTFGAHRVKHRKAVSQDASHDASQDASKDPIGPSCELKDKIESKKPIQPLNFNIDYSNPYPISKVNYKRYTHQQLKLKEDFKSKSKSIDTIPINTKIHVIGKVLNTKYVQVEYEGNTGYVKSKYLSKTKLSPAQTYQWNGTKLARGIGVVQGPSGKETYYNMNMSGVVSIMQRAGYNYNYWIREDGVKMYGEYVMVAADLSIRPRGSLIPTSLGMGIVCDTGTFIYSNPTQLDVAVAW